MRRRATLILSRFVFVEELAGISKDNIVEGERSTRAKDFAKADDELDAQVDNLE